MTENKKVPKLRFKEFDNLLSSKKLEDICTFSKGRGISKNDLSEDGILCIRYGELYTTYNEFIDEVIDMKDLKLVQTENGKYDIAIDENDFVIVEGKEAFKNALIITLNTEYNELKDNPTYKNFGNKALTLKASELSYSEKESCIKKYVKECVGKINEVKKIKNIKITFKDSITYNLDLTVDSIYGDINFNQDFELKK